MNCKFHGEVKPIKSQGYWTAGTLLCPRCYPNGIQSTPEDVLEQQLIDADCNDCKHFQRGALVKQFVGLGEVVIKLGKEGQYFLGHCLKFDKPTKAFPVHYTGHECFEHRKL